MAMKLIEFIWCHHNKDDLGGGYLPRTLRSSVSFREIWRFLWFVIRSLTQTYVFPCLTRVAFWIEEEADETASKQIVPSRRSFYLAQSLSKNRIQSPRMMKTILIMSQSIKE